MLHYWNRLCDMDNNRWPKIVTKCDLSLQTSGWTDHIGQILSYAGIDTDLKMFQFIDLDVVEKQLRKLNEGIWLLEANSKPKLQTFVKLYEKEHARDIVEAKLCRSDRSSLIKLKVGVLPLQIETEW